jgi:hypothetical protein
MVLHQLEQGLDRLPPEIRTETGVRGQRIGFIDEQHAIEGGGHGLAHADGGVADIAGDQGGAVGLDHVAAAEVAEAVEDFAHQPGDRGLAGAGIAEKEAMPGGRGGLVAEASALALGLQLAGCEFQAPQKGLRLINVYAISFIP